MLYFVYFRTRELDYVFKALLASPAAVRSFARLSYIVRMFTFQEHVRI